MLSFSNPLQVYRLYTIPFSQASAAVRQEIARASRAADWP
jgi:hypothetical protein